MPQEGSSGRGAAEERLSPRGDLLGSASDEDQHDNDVPVEVGAGGRSTGVELELPDTDQEDGAGLSPALHDASKIEMQTLSPTIQALMSRLRDGMLDLAPDFQRKSGVWRDEQQSLLIESLLLRIPIPSFYVTELKEGPWTRDSSWAVVDGVQRLTAIARFVAPDALTQVTGVTMEPLRLRGLDYLRDEFEGQRYSDLSGRLQVRLNETQVVVHVIRPGTPEDTQFNIFTRINSGGMPLTRQEIRNAAVPGPTRKLLSSLADSPEFTSATGNGVSSERMADREMALRFLAFRISPPDSFPQRDFDQFLTSAMREFNNLSSEQRTAHTRDFKRSMVAAERIFGAHAFRKLHPGQERRSPINKALFESVAVNLADLSDHEHALLVASRDRVIAGYRQLMTDRDFERAISVGTGSRPQVLTRFTRVRELFRTILDDAGGSTL
ncbi:DUF262 domain-containing protein [Streptomyces globisporus]|uniref:DUF262 domain-containing protein n=1 Tax=Streptomyces globisporus TaxID=1908 RepID=UPI0034612D10